MQTTTSNLPRLLELCTTAMLVMTLVSCEEKPPKTPTPEATPEPTAADAVQEASQEFGNASAAAAASAGDAAPPAASFGFEVDEASRIVRNASRRGSYSLRPDAIRLELGDSIGFDLPRGNWSDCVTPDVADEVLREKTTTWRLDGPAGTIALELGATSIALVAGDESGCTRQRPLTEWYTGVDDDDALLMTGAMDLEDVAQRAEAEPGPDAVTANLTSVISPFGIREFAPDRVTYDLPLGLLSVGLQTPSFGTADRRVVAARQGDLVWLRFDVRTEDETEDVDKALEHDSSLVLEIDDGTPFERFRAERIFAAASREEEDGREVVVRQVPIGNGRLTVRVDRSYYDGAKLIGVGKCPEMEGLVEAQWSDTTTRWSWMNGEESTDLGQASRTTLEVSACEDAVRPEFRGRPTLASDEQKLVPIEWRFASANDPGNVSAASAE